MNKSKLIVADAHLQVLTHLNNDAIIDIVTTEDWNSGEYSITMGYPLTGNTIGRPVKLTWRQIFGTKTWREVLEHD